MQIASFGLSLCPHMKHSLCASLAFDLFSCPRRASSVGESSLPLVLCDHQTGLLLLRHIL